MLKVVIDTNILVSATITPRGNAAKILKAWKDRKIEVVISPKILEEIREVVFRPKIKRLSFWTDKQRNQLLKDLINISFLVPGSLRLRVILEDPPDDKFVIAGVEGKADYIVSGDEHLRKLGSYKGIKIVSPIEFVRILRHHGG